MDVAELSPTFSQSRPACEGVISTQNDPNLNQSAYDEGDLINCCSPALAMGPESVSAEKTGETVLYEFVIINGEAVPVSGSNNFSDVVRATEFVPCEASSNDHTYTQQHPSQFDEAFFEANLANQYVPPSTLQESEPVTGPTDVTPAPPSPRTESWGKLDEGVDIKLQVEEIAGDCTYSATNGQFHVRAQGKFAVTAFMTGLPPNDEEEQYGLMMYLRRTNRLFSHVPIDSVCPAHQHGTFFNPIHPLSEEDRFTTVSTDECGTAQLYNLGKYSGPGLRVPLNLCFPCEDSCVRASSRKDIRNKNAIEKARDSELVVKLVKIHHDGSTEFIVTTCLPVWIKASINPRDLNKAKRREPKGAAAQMAAQKRKVEEQQEIEKKKIRQEIIDDTTFIKRLKKNMKENNFSNELKHCILGLNNDNFKL